ncbi:Fungal-trans domain-containing protein [Fusarium keratoplasticum]|uniref:Fungal-trans domain-containing protein n=1 Tax=Fusarium keratoplasticum TaxID=1328300 RepID=A0ACC0QIT5_9HYPO|nr:Fungal-trans domain-containing protein [Fusarium keratoplasticum]KAI8652728.1 Fungal-trans domain-containing protein [Fusarium keratoplasticum]
MGLPDGSPVLLRPHPGRRREKPQLSCNSCRQRKRKCDRQRPCSHCIKRHLESTCTYTDSSSPSSESRQLHADPSATYDSTVIHPTEFLKRYNAFWEDPIAASVSWLGLLYSIFCLTTQVQSQESCLSRAPETSSCPLPSTEMPRILVYREKVVQCLIQAQFAKGGPDIMETLVHYIVIENNLNKDSNIGVWLLMGNIVQIAIRMGYHRDPRHFKSLSPYQGEMRRRMWAMIYSLDTGFATQMGLPSSIKHSLSDTAPPRNLQNSDFEACSTELPPARPIDELTSSTVIITKFHVAVCMGVVSDMVSSPHALTPEDILAANGKLETTYSSLPRPCQFRPMSESLLDPPSVVSQASSMAIPQRRGYTDLLTCSSSGQRINFYMHYQRARILINWKFLGTSQEPTDSDQSWSVVIEAALEILRLQHLMGEESEVLDASRPTGIPDSCFMNNGYFLAASVACFIVQHRKDKLSPQDLTEVRSLLERSLAIWSSTNDLSREASKVVMALRVVLGKPEELGPQVREVPDAYGRSEIPFSSFTSFFDDLPLMMADADNTGFPSLMDYWPQGDGSM